MELAHYRCLYVALTIVSLHAKYYTKSWPLDNVLIFDFSTLGFLASSWHITNDGMFAASCIGVTLLVVILESLRLFGKKYDDWILLQFRARMAAIVTENKPTSCAPLGATENLSRLPSGQYITFRASPLQQLGRAVIHAVTLGVAYIIMLLAMSYNGYIIICIILGGGLGKFFCDWMTRKVILGNDLGGDSAGIQEVTACCGWRLVLMG